MLGLSIFGIDAGLVALADAVSCCATLERQICFCDSSRICFDSVVNDFDMCVCAFRVIFFPVFVKRVKHQSYESEFMDCARRSMEAKIVITQKNLSPPTNSLPPPFFFHGSTALV